MALLNHAIDKVEVCFVLVRNVVSEFLCFKFISCKKRTVILNMSNWKDF